LEGLCRNFGLLETDTVRIARIGGPGPKIWSLESALDEGDNVIISYADLKDIVISDSDFLDELVCFHPRVIFGISDSSFMFVQGQDKIAEQSTASIFHDVKERPDQAFA
jgi:hypothetical protein